MALAHQSTITQAQQLHSLGDAKGALSVLSEALTHDPANRALLRMRAHVALTNQNIPQAEHDLDAVLSLYPDDPETLDDRGVIYQWQNNYIQAAQYHLRAAEKDLRDGYLLNLAIALAHLGEKKKAEKLYLDTLTLNPGNTKAMVNLGALYDEFADYINAEKYLTQAIQLGDSSFELYTSLGNTHRHLNRKDEAIACYQKALLQRPDNASVRFILATLQGENPDAPPENLIADLFNSYAEQFETSLVGNLKYRGPELLFTAIKPHLEKLQKEKDTLTAMDLGAGTGLFGKLLRPFVQTSIGLDLSEKMLKKAQEQNIYDHILCIDMTKGLAQYPDQHFDIISATDVFVYIGKLDDIFKYVKKSLKPGGLFGFTTEAMTADESGGFIARDTARYAHNENYLKALAAEHNFKILNFEHDWARYNKDKPLDGFIMVLERQ